MRLRRSHWASSQTFTGIACGGRGVRKDEHQPKSRKSRGGDIGEPLADLLRYERGIGYYEHASYALLSTVVHETDGIRRGGNSC